MFTIETDPQSPFCDPEVPPAEWTWRHMLAEACSRGPTFLRAWCAKASVTSVPDFPTYSSGRIVEAFVNHGRWLWRCPDCPEAQVASRDDRRAFCCACFNKLAGWHEVRFPDDLTVLQIETLLGRRPLENRNWFSDEPVDKLQIENLALGLTSDAPSLPACQYESVLPQVRNVLTKRKELEMR